MKPPAVKMRSIPPVTPDSMYLSPSNRVLAATAIALFLGIGQAGLPGAQSLSDAERAEQFSRATALTPTPEIKVLLELGVTPLTPPTIRLNPPTKYWPRMRMWQGIPSLERSPGGRLWATWYAGPISEGREGNFAVLVTSSDDGRTWTNPVAVFDPSLFGNGNRDGAIDAHLWIDPAGRLWWFVNRSLPLGDPLKTRSLWAFRAENCEDAGTEWHHPVFVGYGTGLNKPAVLSNGDWLRPVDLFLPQEPQRTHYYLSRDQGRSYEFLSSVAINKVSYAEHMTVERMDGSLWMLARTTYGIAQLDSFDRGVTWVNDRPFTTGRGVNTRFFVRRLKSGAILMIYNDARSRSRMTAQLSLDDGRTWPYQLLLDEREQVSYPDGVEGSNGFLYIAYDRGRYMKDQQELLFAKFTEEDIRAGRLINPESRLKQMINRLSDFDGGVHFDRENHKWRMEYETTLGLK